MKSGVELPSKSISSTSSSALVGRGLSKKDSGIKGGDEDKENGGLTSYQDWTM